MNREPNHSKTEIFEHEPMWGCMKIAMVCFAGATDAPEGSPQAGRVPGLATALVDQGHDVAVYVREGASGAGRGTMMGGARVVPIPGGPPHALTEAEATPHAGPFAERLREALARQRPDVVHSHGWLAGVATLLSGGEDRAPVVHTFHRPWLLPRPGPKVGRTAMNRCRAERAIARRADQLIASSLDEQLSLMRIGVPRARVSLVPPGVDCEELPPDGIQEPREGRFRLVIFGRSDRADGGIEAAMRALTALPDTELVIAPEPAGSSWVPAEAERTRQLADRLRVADRVRLEDEADHSQRRELVRSADTVLCLDLSQGQGAMPLEAMACAAPIITTPGADRLGAVIDGVTGVHVDANDPKLLALAVRQLLDNPALRQGLGLAGRDRAVHRYGWSHIAAETGRLYRQLVDRPAANAVTAEVTT